MRIYFYKVKNTVSLKEGAAVNEHGVTNSDDDIYPATLDIGDADTPKEGDFYLVTNAIRTAACNVKLHRQEDVDRDAYNSEYNNPTVCGYAIDPSNEWGTRDTNLTSWKNYAMSRYADWGVIHGQQPCAIVTGKR